MEFKKALDLLDISISHSDYPNIIKLASRLNKPLFVFDTETTGLLGYGAVGIVEFAFFKINPDGTSQSASTFINPEMVIPASASAIHGIYAKDVESSINLNHIAPALNVWLKDCVVSGYNTRGYDINVVNQNLIKYGHQPLNELSQLDVRDVWMRIAKTQRGKLVDVASNYGVVAIDSHRAMGDVVTTVRLLEAMIIKHGEDSVLESLSGMSRPTTQPSEEAKKVNAITAMANSENRFVNRKWVNRGERVQSAIKAHVAQYDKFGISDYPSIIKSCEGFIVTPSVISFALSDLLGRGELTEAQLVDEQLQSIINSKLEEVIEMVGSTGSLKLKPIKEGLDAVTGQDIDYIQLRIALSIRERTLFTSPTQSTTF